MEKLFGKKIGGMINAILRPLVVAIGVLFPSNRASQDASSVPEFLQLNQKPTTENIISKDAVEKPKHDMVLPMQPTPELELGKIPQILGLLTDEGELTNEQKKMVLDEIEANGGKGYAGEVAIAKGFLTKTSLDESLLEQTARKAEASVKDIQNIAKDGTHGHPPFLKANWGNNGVNPAKPDSTITDGISAAANIAQNMVMVANDNPKLAGELKSAVAAAANLARSMKNGESATLPLTKKGQEWLEEAKQGMHKTVHQSGIVPLDGKGQIIDGDVFIQERFKEIERGIQLAQDRDRGKPLPEVSR